LGKYKAVLMLIFSLLLIACFSDEKEGSGLDADLFDTLEKLNHEKKMRKDLESRLLDSENRRKKLHEKLKVLQLQYAELKKKYDQGSPRQEVSSADNGKNMIRIASGQDTKGEGAAAKSEKHDTDLLELLAVYEKRIAGIEENIQAIIATSGDGGDQGKAGAAPTLNFPTKIVERFCSHYGGSDMEKIAGLTSRKFRDEKPEPVWIVDTWKVLNKLRYKRIESSVIDSIVDGDRATITVKAAITTREGEITQKETYRLRKIQKSWLIDELEVSAEDVESEKVDG